MAEPLPQPKVPFTKEFSPYNQKNQSAISAEDVRARLHKINDYFNQNTPSVIKGMSMFEQDLLDSDIADRKPNSFDQYDDLPQIQNERSGNILTGRPQLTNFPTFENVSALSSQVKYDSENSVDPYKFAKPTSFNASIYGHNYDRYYSHPKFKSLGFDLRRDNESLYNANSTFLDDFRRMGSKLVSNIALAGTDSAKNWGNWFSFSGNPNSSALMEHNMASGASSKEGVGAWVTNFTGNLGYTLGTIGELWIENAIVTAAAALTRNPTLLALAGTKSVLGLSKLAKSMTVMAKTLNNVNKARQFRTAAWSVPKSLVQAANPFRELTKIGGQALNPNSAFNRLNSMAKASKSFGAFYRGIREINAVTAESRLEAAFVQNKVANKAIDEYYKKNGKLPEGPDADEIVEKARLAGEKTFIANVPVIYASNQLVLGTSLRGFVPRSRLISASNLKGTFFKTVRNFDWKKTGKSPMEVVANTTGFKYLGNLVKKDFWKSVPSKLTGTYASKPFSRALGSGIRYFSANLAEGLQESYQEAVQETATDYYLKQYFADLYKDPLLAANNSVAASVHKGIGSQLTSQGLDTFLQGFLTGGVVGPVQTNIVKFFESVNLRMKDYKNPGDRAKYMEDEKKRLQKYADAVNSYTQDPVLWSKWISENAINQRDFHEKVNLAEEIGDRASAENAKDDAMFAHVDTLLRAGKFDEFIDHLKGLTELTDDELKDAFDKYNVEGVDENVKTPRERLDIAINKAKEIKGRIEELNKHENPFNPDMFDPAIDIEAYIAESVGYETFETAKRAIAFNEYTYKRTAERIESILNKSVTSGPLGSISAVDFSILFSPLGLSEETSQGAWYNYEQLLKAEIQSLKAGTPEEKKLAEYKKEQLAKLKDLKAFIIEYRKARVLINKAKGAAQDYASASKESKDAYDTLKKMAQVLNSESKNGDIEADLNDPNTSVDVIVDAFIKNNLYDAYKEYVNVIAKSTDTTKVENTVNKSFNEFLDYLQLSSDHHLMGQFMTALSDPMAVYNMAARLYNARKLSAERSAELHKIGLEEYISKIAAPDALMQGLFDIGVYFDPDFIDEFLKENIIPPYFLNVTDGSYIEQDDPKYNQIVDLIETYAIQSGKKFANIPKKYVAPVAPVTPVSSDNPPDDEEEDSDSKEASATDTLKDFAPDLRILVIQAAKDKGLTVEQFMDLPEFALLIDNYNKTKSKSVDISTVTGSVTVSNPKSITPEMMPGMDKILEASSAEEWEVDPDDKRYYRSKTDKTKRIRRATSLLNKNFEESARLTAYQNRGNVLDELLRSFFSPEINKDGAITKLAFRDVLINMFEGKKAGVYTEAAIKNTIKDWINKNLSDETLYAQFKLKATPGFINGVADVLYAIAGKLKDYRVVSSMPTMYGMSSTGELVGGTLDLLAELPDGTLHIFDIKTFAADRLGQDTRNSDIVQQNTYREIIESNSDRKVSKLNTIQIKITLLNDLETLVAAELKTNSTGGILNAVPIKNVKDALAEIESGAKPEESGKGGPETPPTPMFLRNRFAGKLVYMPPGAGKTFAVQAAQKKGIKIIDMDDLLVEAVSKAGINLSSLGFSEVNNKNVGNVLYAMYSNGMNEQADKIYESAMSSASTLLKSGYTVLTGSTRFMDKADIVIKLKDKTKTSAQLAIKSGRTPEESRSFIEGIIEKGDKIFDKSPEKVEILLEDQTALDLLFSEVEKETPSLSETPQVDKMRKAASDTELELTLKSYLINNEIYTYTSLDGSRRIYTPTQIAEIAKNRATELGLSSSFLDHIDEVLGLSSGPITKAEEKAVAENVEAAIDNNPDASTVSDIGNNVASGNSEITDEDLENLNNCDISEP